MTEKFTRRKALEMIILGSAGIGLNPHAFVNSFENFDNFIKKNTAEIKTIIEEQNYEKALENPYLVSTLFYSNEYLDKIKSENQSSVSGRISKEILNFLNLDFKKGFIEYLTKVFQDKYEGENSSHDCHILEEPTYAKDLSRAHDYALDLFGKEGSPVSALTSGIVVLAEDGWKKDDEISTSSPRGGNSIIIYNPDQKEFQRYAHLQSLSFDIEPGAIVFAGQQIASLGSTGMVASMKNRGKHVHLEIHELNEEKIGNNRVLATEIMARLMRID